MRLARALEDRGLDRWKDETSRCRMTRDEFLDIMAELISYDTEIRALQIDVENAERRRREGAIDAVLAVEKAGLLNPTGRSVVREWKERSAEGLFGDLATETVRIVPPDRSRAA